MYSKKSVSRLTCNQMPHLKSHLFPVSITIDYRSKIFPAKLYCQPLGEPSLCTAWFQIETLRDVNIFGAHFEVSISRRSLKFFSLKLKVLRIKTRILSKFFISNVFTPEILDFRLNKFERAYENE